MDYIKETEKWLYNYNTFKAAIENLKIMYTEKEKELREGHPVQYDKERLSKTNSFISETEERGVELATIKGRIEIMENKIKIMDNALNALNDTEKSIIDLRYLKGEQWWQIANNVMFSERWCKEIRKNAVKKIALSMFGKI